jgi:hypothetical protein
MQLQSLPKPLSTAVFDACKREGVRVGPASVPELIAAAFGFWTGKLARDFAHEFNVRLFASIEVIDFS